MTFRQFLQAELKRKAARNPQYSLRAFAKHLGVEPATLSQMLRGTRKITPATIRRLGVRLGLDEPRIAAFTTREPVRGRSRRNGKERKLMGRPVTQWQIVTRNPERLAEFYSSLFGWEVNNNDTLNYRMVDTASEKGIDGGIWPAPPEANSFVQLFVEVDAVAPYVESAKSLGAKIIIPPQTLPDGDEIAILHDPEGVPFAVYRPAVV